MKNESSSKQFIKKFDKFTNHAVKVRIKWSTENVKSLFRVKYKFLHEACKICKPVCLCIESYIGKTIRNVEVRWDEYNDEMKKSNPSTHIKDNLDHVFIWTVLANARRNLCMFKRKVPEVYYIVLEKATLNEHLSLTD